MLGKRNYTITDKCKRPQKNKVDLKVIQDRNRIQKKIFINLSNIQEIFSENMELPLNYHIIRSHIFAKTFKFLPTVTMSRRNEVTEDCIIILYSTLYRKLLGKKETKTLFSKSEEPEIFFYYSQFLRYIELMVYSYCFYHTRDLNVFVEMPEDVNIFDITGETDTNLKKTEQNVNRYKIRHFIRTSPLEEKDKTLLLSILNSRKAQPIDSLEIENFKQRLDNYPEFRDKLLILLQGGID